MPAPIGHEEFFTSLTTLLTNTSQKARGSVYLTQKPLLNTNTATDANPSDTQSESRPSILIRATDGDTNAPNPKTHDFKNKDKSNKKETKVKISTVVALEDLEAFYTRYAEVCKAGMTGLKKRDRKLKKAKAKGGAGKVGKA
ncbi:signal recognition particle 14 kDa protein [Aspergillus undulatus]|uniref:signal recognition particle 14 kDa protein n=1 Tax=Aspergillus undulatus TaxID=1810928 RepID=UPI003CCD9EB9